MTAAHRQPARRAGMTLIELIVAVTILVVMIVAFSQILNQSQTVLTGAQRTMRDNSAAHAVIQTLREDVRRATANGLICISQGNYWVSQPGMAPNYGRPPRLTILAAGVTRSKTHPHTSTGGLSVLGLCGNATRQTVNSPELATPAVLYAQHWVLTQVAAPPPMPTDVLDFLDMSYYVALPRRLNGFGTSVWPDGPNDMNDVATILEMVYVPREGGVLPALRIPAQTPNEAMSLWQVLASRCQALGITWTDGSGSPTNWYGVDYTMNQNGTPEDYSDDFPVYSINAQNSNWTIPGAAANVTEFNASKDNDYASAYMYSSGDFYRALWTHHNQDNWPTAIRIRFHIAGDSEDPMDPGRDYEAICPLGR